MKMVNIVFGGAGFIGENLVRDLVRAGEAVVVVDKNDPIDSVPGVVYHKIDINDLHALYACLGDISPNSKVSIWHLAANSDIQLGVENVLVDLHDTLITTVNIARYSEKFSECNIIFASSSAVYGDHGGELLNEELSQTRPISNYGAAKLASEAFLRAHVEANPKMNCFVFRFPNVIGIPSTHGVIFDFVNKLMCNPSQLNVLGDGEQCKQYLHVNDLITAMKIGIRQGVSQNEGFSIYNISNNDAGCSVKTIAKTVVEKMSLDARIIYGREDRGWIGDIPKFRLDTRKINDAGFSPNFSSRQAIELAVSEIINQLSKK